MSDFASRLTDVILAWFPIIFGFGVLLAFTVFIIRGISQHRRERQRRVARSALEAQMKYFVYAKIMESILPMARAAKYEDPLSEALEAARLGLVTGGGTQMGEGDAIAWVGLDLALADLDGAVQFTRQRLRELGAPAGSVLEYRIGEEKISVEIA
jgi:hypothetical protein